MYTPIVSPLHFRIGLPYERSSLVTKASIHRSRNLPMDNGSTETVNPSEEYPASAFLASELLDTGTQSLDF